jgi:hypothetical protein
MKVMAPTPAAPASRWHQSLYWRIGIGFVVFVAAVVIVRTAFVSYTIERSTTAFPNRSPNTIVAAVAVDAAAALTRDANAAPGDAATEIRQRSAGVCGDAQRRPCLQRRSAARP